MCVAVRNSNGTSKSLLRNELAGGWSWGQMEGGRELALVSSATLPCTQRAPQSTRHENLPLRCETKGRILFGDARTGADRFGVKRALETQLRVPE